MAKNKLKRFSQNENEYKDLIHQPSREELEAGLEMKGNWSERFFGNNKPIVLELGCGRGEYSIELAKYNPQHNFIGVDIKGARLWTGAQQVVQEGLTNCKFLRCQIEMIEHCFATDEIDEIWITFPDPQLKYRRTKHRLTHPTFLERYANFLKPDGIVHLKTDSELLHGYTMGILDGYNHEVLLSHHDIYHTQHLPHEVVDIKTYYENKFLSEQNKPITYIKFKLNRG